MVTAPPNGDAWRDPVAVGTTAATIYMQNRLHGCLCGIYVTNTSVKSVSITLRMVRQGKVESSAHDLLSGLLIAPKSFYSWDGRVPFDNGDVLTVFADLPGLNLRIVVGEDA